MRGFITILFATVTLSASAQFKRDNLDSLRYETPVFISKDSAKIYDYWIKSRPDWRYTPIINKTDLGFFEWRGWSIMSVLLYDNKYGRWY